MQLNDHELDRLKRYKEQLEFYHGRHWLSHTGRGDKQPTFNYAKTIIDKIASYVMSGVHHTVVTLEDSDGARQRAREAETETCNRYISKITWSSSTWIQRLTAPFWAMAAIRFILRTSLSPVTCHQPR